MPKTKATSKAKTSAKPKATKAEKPSQSTSTTRATSTTTAAAATTPRPKNIFTRRFRNDLTLGALFAELLGAFGLTAVLLNTSGNAIVAGVAVLVFVMVFGRISGGHVNPAVTLGMLALRKISALRAAGYIVAQVLGAMLALVVIGQFVSAAPATPPTMDPYTGQEVQGAAAKIFAVADLQGDWRPFFAETLGAIVLGFGVAAAGLSRRDDIEKGYIIGGSLMLGLLLATQASAAIVNPAIAIGLGAYKLSNWWTVLVYAVAPLIGTILGALAYKFIKHDSELETT
ncbi:MAG TPA: aquaporin [Candidatus Saccharimonas sp.]|nr:aquaporin [Candidatus Saccharimonas sp.]